VTLAADASLVVAANYNGNAYFWAPANGASAEDLTPIRKLQVSAGVSSANTQDVWRFRPGLGGMPEGLRVASRRLPSPPACPHPRPSLYPQAHRSYVLSARLSPDVRLLATASADRTVKLWNTSDGSLYTTLAGAWI
jgi:WD40 repeat protein